jgi:hypothetical protein
VRHGDDLKLRSVSQAFWTGCLVHPVLFMTRGGGIFGNRNLIPALAKGALNGDEFANI